jgi:hypothetical protein
MPLRPPRPMFIGHWLIKRVISAGSIFTAGNQTTESRPYRLQA